MVLRRHYGIDKILRNFFIGNVLAMLLLEEDADLILAIAVIDGAFDGKNLLDIFQLQFFARHQNDKDVQTRRPGSACGQGRPRRE